MLYGQAQAVKYGSSVSDEKETLFSWAEVSKYKFILREER